MNQITNNFVSQAGQMKLGVIPNDTIQALNPIACVLLGPIIQQLLYPGLQTYGVAFGSISRMTWSFITISSSMGYAAGLQKLIYTRGPCYESPRNCADSDGGKIPNNISVWVQTPSYFLLAFAEILGFTTLSEYSYSEAPKDMRSLVQALRQVTAAIGSALGMALSPVAVDPKVIYMYTGLAATMIAAAPVFWAAFRSYDNIDDEDGLNEIGLMQPDSHDEMEETAARAHP
jgi:Dipeptide/tripeptide permease